MDHGWAIMKGYQLFGFAICHVKFLLHLFRWVEVWVLMLMLTELGYCWRVNFFNLVIPFEIAWNDRNIRKVGQSGQVLGVTPNNLFQWKFSSNKNHSPAW